MARKLKIKSKKVTKKKTTEVANTPVQEIKKSYLAFKEGMQLALQAQEEAFDRMFNFGTVLLENEKAIKKEYGTWKHFGQEEGIDPSLLSRCRASVADFIDHNADTLAKARKLLKDRGFTPSAKLMEQNINRLLTDSDKAGEKKSHKEKEDKRDQHLKELHTMQSRAEEVIAQHEPDDEIYEEARHTVEFVKASIKHLESLDISQKEWNNKAYRQFCRDIKFDIILGEPVEASEPMHLSPDGTSGSMGGKVADFFCIPGCRDTHEKLDNDELNVSKEEIAFWHRWTMAMFIYHHINSDK